MPRLFVALRPPSAIREQLQDLQEGLPDARWQDDDQLHLTVRFIGEVDARIADDILLALADVRAGLPPLALHGVGQFAKAGRPHSLWAGVVPAAPLAALHKKVDHALVRVGLAPDPRAYLPHITLARFSRSTRPDLSPFLATHAGLISAPFTVAHFGLYESTLTPAGAAYELVERFPLA